MTASQESLIESEIEFAQIVRRLVAERIGAEPDEIEWDDELTLLGVDSIALMSVLEWFLETHNRRVPYADAVAAGTLAGLVRTMVAQPEVHSPANSNVEIPQVNEHKPFGLSVMSQAIASDVRGCSGDRESGGLNRQAIMQASADAVVWTTISRQIGLPSQVECPVPEPAISQWFGGIL